MNNAIEGLLSEINDAEDQASKASTALQRTREELVRRFAPVQVGDKASWQSDGVARNVRVINVQVAKSGRHGHKFTATGDILTDDGTETTTRITQEWEIETDMPENFASAQPMTKGKAAPVAKSKAASPAKRK